jgi:hypothetical protein
MSRSVDVADRFDARRLAETGLNRNQDGALLGQRGMPIKPSRMSHLFVQDEQGFSLAALDDCEVSPRYVGDFLGPIPCHLVNLRYCRAVSARRSRPSAASLNHIFHYFRQRRKPPAGARHRCPAGTTQVGPVRASALRPGRYVRPP